MGAARSSRIPGDEVGAAGLATASGKSISHSITEAPPRRRGRDAQAGGPAVGRPCTAEASGGDGALGAQGLDGHFGREPSLSDLDLSVRHGEVVASSSVTTDAGSRPPSNAESFGLVAPECGEVLVNGVPLAPEHGRPRPQAGVGLVPATRNVFDDLPVHENLRLGGRQEPDLAELERRTARVLSRCSQAPGSPRHSRRAS